MNNNIDPLKELKDFFGESNEPIANKEITELEKMVQKSKETGKMTGKEPWFYD